ncbi:MAG TPA: hypothetical protein VFH54_15275 [Mycobacteriales bacterium]|nr:hypothetical protein [Mycobacteriales bacterium]
MTITLAISCPEGVVLASDSMGSANHVATSIPKVRVAPHLGVAWTTTGSEFLDQAVGKAIQSLSSDSAHSPREIADAIRPVITSALDQPLPPADGSTSRHHVECLLAAWTPEGPSLVHLPADLAPIECIDKSFVATGSAHEFAHVVFATLQHLLSAPVTLGQAMLLAYRIVNTVCTVSSWGVALPVQLATVTKDGVRLLDGRDLEELNAQVINWLAFEASQFEAPISPGTAIAVVSDAATDNWEAG